MDSVSRVNVSLDCSCCLRLVSHTHLDDERAEDDRAEDEVIEDPLKDVPLTVDFASINFIEELH